MKNEMVLPSVSTGNGKNSEKKQKMNEESYDKAVP